MTGAFEAVGGEVDPVVGGNLVSEAEREWRPFHKEIFDAEDHITKLVNGFSLEFQAVEWSDETGDIIPSWRVRLDEEPLKWHHGNRANR